jgi:hypothetical protein
MEAAKILGVIGLCPNSYHRQYFDQLDDKAEWDEPIIGVSFFFHTFFSEYKEIS